MSESTARVLLVEDEEAHVELIRRSFESFEGPIELSVANSLEEARRLLDQSVPSLVISDLRLPDGNGVALIPTEDQEAAYPVVVMTSHGDEKVAVEAMKAGVIDYVVKSEITLAQMPFIAERALREWSHMLEQRRMEEALRESEEHFRSLIDTAQDMVAILNEDGSIEYVNPSSLRILGLTPEELVGASALDLVHPEDITKAKGALEEILTRGGTAIPVSFRLRAKDGAYRILESVGAIHPHEREGKRAVLSSRDITEKTLAEQAKSRLEGQLRQSRRLETLGTLAGGIAHDFSNLLQAIVGSTELAKVKLPSDNPAATHLQRVLDASVRARELVRQILIFSRRGEQERRRLELQPLVQEVLRLLEATFPSGIEIRSEISADVEAVIGDPTQIHQVLMNLCTNAQHAMRGSEGLLEIKLVPVSVDPELISAHANLRPGPYARLSISDNGRGMPEEIRERAFEPFFTTKGVGEGSGLGLSVAHGIVHSHGGDITIESEPGKGTKFHVYLPTAEEGETGVQDERMASLEHKRILFVDDEDLLVHIGKTLLEGMGHEVTGLTSGRSALVAFGSDPDSFDVVMIDHTMPYMSGLELAQELRRERSDLKVVLMTSPAEKLAPEVLEQHGISASLAKPFAPRDLADALESLAG